MTARLPERAAAALMLLAGISLAVAAQAQDPQQVNVSVKIIEFQTTKGVETGLSAFFKQRIEPEPYGRVVTDAGAITTADITFPTSSTAGITVFLDRLVNSLGEFEVVLQALVDENRARILARPKALVPVGQEVPTIIETTQDIPFESSVVVGSTIAQVTEFRPTGVQLRVQANQIIDDDGDPNTIEDTYIQLKLYASVNEEGQRITIALDDLVAPGSGATSNAISVPEFVSRSIDTTTWVRHGQVLILGGLYRNTKNKDLSTLPWLTQTEDVINGLVQRVLPFTTPAVPITTGAGNQDTTDSRRELVFLVKAEVWKPAYTVASDLDFEDEETEQDDKKKRRLIPQDVIGGVLGEIGELGKDVVEGVSGEKMGDDPVDKELGDPEE